MFFDIIKVIAYFAVCIFIIWLSMKATKLYAGGGMSRFTATRYIKLLDKMSFGKDSGVGIIQIGERYMLVSMANGRVDILCELSEDDLVDFRESEPSVNVYDTLKDSIAGFTVSAVNKFKSSKKNEPKKGDFSRILRENTDDDVFSEFVSHKDEEDIDEDSIVDELLKSTEKRAREFRGKKSGR